MDWAGALRKDICERAKRYAQKIDVSFYESRGVPPTVLFTRAAHGQSHGNFLSASYAAILARQDWAARLSKAHPRRNALPLEATMTAMELDSCTSSDALLMNVFCCPDFPLNQVAKDLFDLAGIIDPQFGMPGKVPLATGGEDRTEIDLALGSILIESKLTERSFTVKAQDVVGGYRDFAELFDEGLLPHIDTAYCGYQVIRNVLAAHATGRRSFLICDARRPDLIREWWSVIRAVKDSELRARCGFVLWQELAEYAAGDLRAFLTVKYGLLPD